MEDELCLLREVLAMNPFEDAARWLCIKDIVKEKMDKEFTIRALKEHLELLLKKFIEKDDKNIKKTGIEEGYHENDHLLQDIKQLRNDFLEKKTLAHPNSIKQSMAKGKAIRENSLQLFKNQMNTAVLEETENMPVDDKMKYTIPEGKNATCQREIEMKPRITQSQNTHAQEKAPGVNVLTPYRRRQPKKLKNSALDFLTNRSAQENHLKEKELQLEGKKLEIEDRKLKIEEKRLNHHEIDI